MSFVLWHETHATRKDILPLQFFSKSWALNHRCVLSLFCLRNLDFSQFDLLQACQSLQVVTLMFNYIALRHNSLLGTVNLTQGSCIRDLDTTIDDQIGGRYINNPAAPDYGQSDIMIALQMHFFLFSLIRHTILYRTHLLYELLLEPVQTVQLKIAGCQATDLHHLQHCGMPP